jgi:hypothetical protein
MADSCAFAQEGIFCVVSPESQLVERPMAILTIHVAARACRSGHTG